jgi:hypothetical protein
VAVGLRIGSETMVRYRIGSVPGMGKTPDMYETAARLPDKGSQWDADEGNGGLATYAAMSKWDPLRIGEPSL